VKWRRDNKEIKAKPIPESQLRAIEPETYAKIGEEIIKGKPIPRLWEVDELEKLKEFNIQENGLTFHNVFTNRIRGEKV